MRIPNIQTGNPAALHLSDKTVIGTVVEIYKDRASLESEGTEYLCYVSLLRELNESEWVVWCYENPFDEWWFVKGDPRHPFEYKAVAQAAWKAGIEHHISEQDPRD